MPKGPKPSYVRWLDKTDERSAKHAWGSRKFKHSRQMRAKCRLLFKAGVSQAALVREFGGVPVTMTRVIDNDYAQKDVEEEDLSIARLDPTFQARLDHLRVHGFDNPNAGRHQPHRRMKQTNEAKKKGEAKQEEEIQGRMANPIITRSDSPPSTATPVPNNQQPPPPEAADSVLAFLTQISLTKLYQPLKNIGVDAAGLHRMGHYDEQRLDAFMMKLAKLVPEMTPFDRLTLSDEIRGLADGPGGVA
ncbi:hypothetical protein DFH09DRAFT_1363182 [Mycena vulgaris]|nr:hypothetical protein DFH09DRAFT_1363182 [Mycena vulgaris]